MSNNLFSTELGAKVSGVVLKSHLLKRQIISCLSSEPLMTVAELSSRLNVSTPTITKLIAELTKDKYIKDMGKIETAGGRRPASYALCDEAGYFLGIEVANGNVRFALSNMNGNIVKYAIREDAYAMTSNETVDIIAKCIEEEIENFGVDKAKILGQGIAVRGRVNSLAGYSYNFLNIGNTPLSEVMAQKTGIRTIVENDTRSVAFADYIVNGENREENRLFIYADKGVGVGIIIDGKLYYGKSGFSGEFGHIPVFDNQIICHCGKKGCLETEASGTALENMLQRSVKEGRSSILSEKIENHERVDFNEIIDAALKEDVLSIELVGAIGEKLGRGIGILMNLFNPTTVIVGGGLSRAGDYLLLPIRTALSRYSLSLVNNDSQLRLATLDINGGVVGAALLTRHHILCEEF